MKKPKIALVGRPNVGKSSLFNRICKKRSSIVDEMEGVTRDRLYGESEIFGQEFILIDTGGIDLEEKIPFWEEVRGQAEHAIHEADAIILVVDGKVGITKADEEIARKLRSSTKPLILAINKVDNEKMEKVLHDFYNLGIEKMLTVSATQGSNIAELLELAIENAEGEEETFDPSIKVAIIGRPNVGKSTLLNYLLGAARSVVSDIAGTTRDAIDAHVEFGDKQYLFIDTAGLRRKHKEPDAVDKFARIRTMKAIERADICLFMIDGPDGLTTQEKHYLNEIEKQGKGALLFFNKWDLISGHRMEHCEQAIRQMVPSLSYAPMIFGSAKEGRNLDKIFTQLEKIYEALTARITTGQLNSFLEKTMQLVHPPMIKGKRLRVYYMTQVKSLPPHFILFVNHTDRMTRAYEKYLLNSFRKQFSFTGAPIRWNLCKKKKAEFHPDR
ncbi:MAG: ribosome biogenesis GTPase Der [Chlamydiales bacterium]